MSLTKRIVWLLLVCISNISMQAQIEAEPKHYDTPLTTSQVREFLKTNIEISKLQKYIQAHADEYNKLERGEIHAFYEKRKALIKSRGWDFDEYEEVKDRVNEARGTMRQYENFKEEQAQQKQKKAENGYAQDEQRIQDGLQEMINQIEENEFLSAEQKEKMIADLKKKQEDMAGSGQKWQEATSQLSEKEEHRLTANKQDWPVVKPFIEKMDQISEWFSGNRADPPVID